MILSQKLQVSYNSKCKSYLDLRSASTGSNYDRLDSELFFQTNIFVYTSIDRNNNNDFKNVKKEFSTVVLTPVVKH